jgi:hypothetical protein
MAGTISVAEEHRHIAVFRLITLSVFIACRWVPRGSGE